MLSFLYGPTLISIHDYWKTIALTIWTFVGKVMSLLGKGPVKKIIVIQVGIDTGVDQDKRGEDGEKWSEFV